MPPASFIHPIFHVSQLQEALNSVQAAVTLPPLALPSIVLKPIAILDEEW